MDNAYFAYSDQEVEIERFHLCTWEFKNESALVEIGCEIKAGCISGNKGKLSIDLYIPWLVENSNTIDLYDRLKDAANSKFIFNDSVVNTASLDGGRGLMGVIHNFQLRDPLCILPVQIVKCPEKSKIVLVIDLVAYNHQAADGINVYFRFAVVPDLNSISTRKKGISRSTIIYDIKVNERRNLPDSLIAELHEKQLCRINSSFCFNIVPNSYDLTFFDASSLINVRTLEYDSFNRYLDDKRVQEDELMVVFNKKKHPDSYAFFVIFTKERIGTGQFALAVLVSLLSGILLFLPGYREKTGASLATSTFWIKLPWEVYIAIFSGISLILYFVWPTLVTYWASIRLWFQTKLTRKK